MNTHCPRNYSKRTQMIQQRTASLRDNYGVDLPDNPQAPNRGATLADIRAAEKRLCLRWTGNVNHRDARHIKERE